MRVGWNDHQARSTMEETSRLTNQEMRKQQFDCSFG